MSEVASLRFISTLQLIDACHCIPLRSVIMTVGDIVVDPETMRPKAGEQHIQLVGLLKQSLKSGWSLPVLKTVDDVTFADAESIMRPAAGSLDDEPSASGVVLAVTCALRPRGSAGSVVWVLHLADSDVPVAFKGASNIVNRNCLCPGSPVEIVGVLKRGSVPVGGRRRDIHLAESKVSVRRLGDGHVGLKITITYVLPGGAVLGSGPHNELTLVCLHQWCRCQSEVLCPKMVIECYGLTEVPSKSLPVSRILMANIHSTVIIRWVDDVQERRAKLDPLYKLVTGLPSSVHEGCPLHAARALCHHLDPQIESGPASRGSCTNQAPALGYASLLSRPEPVRPSCDIAPITFRELPACWRRQIFECARNMMPQDPFKVARAPSVSTYSLATGLPCRNAVGIHVGGPVVVGSCVPPDALTDKNGVVVRCAKGVCYFQCSDGTLGHCKADPRPAMSVIGRLSDQEEKLALSHAASLHPLLDTVEEVSRMPPSSPFTLKAVVICEILHSNLSRAPDVLLANVNAEGWDVAIQDVAPTGRLLRVWISRSQLKREIPVPSLVDISDAVLLISDFVPERHTAGPFRPVFAVLLPTGFVDLRWPRLPLAMFPHASPEAFWIAGRVSWLREIDAFTTCCNCGDKIYLLSACSCARIRLVSAAELPLDNLEISWVAKGEIENDMGFCFEATFVGEAALAVCADSSLSESQSDGIKRFIVADGGGTAVLASRESRESKWDAEYLGFAFPEQIRGKFCLRGERREDGLYVDRAKKFEAFRGGTYARLERNCFRMLEMME
ncbi:hypothetical protein FOZ62_019756 [Perkinsus olseni]|uniref:Uncharacterized protein n=1 Tax=Perkinsus olseni TaxID=32597 RepID=A0A7J6RW29_PEROL|nr:hypothetical protein FOZ62_019756 [Perkinsus olseni]